MSAAEMLMLGYRTLLGITQNKVDVPCPLPKIRKILNFTKLSGPKVSGTVPSILIFLLLLIPT